MAKKKVKKTSKVGMHMMPDGKMMSDTKMKKMKKKKGMMK